MLADIAGKPMVIRVAEQAVQSHAARVVVATDHHAIALACQAHGVQYLMTQEKHPSGTDRLADAATARTESSNRVSLVDVQVELRGRDARERQQPLGPRRAKKKKSGINWK